jgi:hypothetical protein
MDKIKIELRFDDKEEVKLLNVYYCEFEQLIHNKEIIADGNEYLISKSTAINVGEELWYRFDCKLKGGLRSRSSVQS